MMDFCCLWTLKRERPILMVQASRVIIIIIRMRASAAILYR